jgi:tRNA (guanine-N7-)-methyltransferase
VIGVGEPRPRELARVPPTRVAGAGAAPEALFGDGAEPLRRLLAGLAEGEWEVEIGFGKGRYLLRRAGEEPAVRFLGVELVGEYFRLAARRAARRGLDNLVLLQGEAQYLLATVLPRGFARAVHVYFPDPWPKGRHQRRRLFHEQTVDLVLGMLRPGGRLLFASDHPDYGPAVAELLESRTELAAHRRHEVWDDGPRTNYEAKYVEEGRSIVRVEAELIGAVPEPPVGVACAWVGDQE